MPKSAYDYETMRSGAMMGRSYYCFCLEQALENIKQARALVKGDKTDDNHELPRIERLISQALEAS